MINKIQNKHTLKTKHKYKFKGGTPEGVVACFAFSAGCFALRYAIIKIGEKTVGTCKVCKKVIRDEMGKSLLNGGDRNIKYEIGSMNCPGLGIGHYDLNKEMPICPDCWSKMIRERVRHAQGPQGARQSNGEGTGEEEKRARLCRRKRAPSPYNIFVKEKYAEIKASNPELDRTQIFSEIARMWQEEKAARVEPENVKEPDQEDEESKYKQKKITEYFKKNSNSPSRNSPSRNSPSRNSPSRNSPSRNSPSRNSPKFLDGNRRNDKIKEEINKNYPELTSIQKNKLYETLLKTELHWKKGGKKEEKKEGKRRKKGGKKEEKNYTK